MRKSSYHKSQEEVYKKLKSILLRMHFDVLEDDLENGFIVAKRDKSLFKAAIVVEITFEKIDEHCTQVTIESQAENHLFNKNVQSLEEIEERILNLIS